MKMACGVTLFMPISWDLKGRRAWASQYFIPQWFQHGDNSSNAGVMRVEQITEKQENRTFSYSREDVTTEKGGDLGFP
jgi:hypothetical protein